MTPGGKELREGLETNCRTLADVSGIPLKDVEFIFELGARWAFEKAAQKCERIGDVWVVKGALDMQPMDGEYAKSIRALAASLAAKAPQEQGNE